MKKTRFNIENAKRAVRISSQIEGHVIRDASSEKEIAKKSPKSKVVDVKIHRR